MRKVTLITIVTVLAMTTGLFAIPELVVADEVLLNGEIPSDLFFKPGRILEDGTIWFCGIDGTAKTTYVFRSIDDGVTFTHNATAVDGRAAQMDAFDENTAVFATANGKIYLTTDGGDNFTEVYSYDISMLAPGWFDGIRVLNDSVAVAFGDTETPGLMHFVRTTDKGATWSEIEGIDYLGASYGYYTFGMGACNVGESIWCAGLTSAYDSGYVFRSYDAGVTWESFKIPEDVIDLYPRSIGFMDDDNGLISDRYGSVLKSIDGGETWTQTNKPDTSSSSWVNGVVWIPGTDIMVGLDDIGAFYTSDLGETWTAIEAPTVDMSGDYYISGVFKDTEFGYIFTDAGKVLRFKDQVPSGITKELVVADEVLLNGEIPSDLFFKPGRILEDGTIWFCGIDGTAKTTYVFRSIDDGVTFTHNATAVDGRAAQMDAFDENTAVFATANGKIYLTTDGGDNFTEVYSYDISMLAPGWFDGIRVLNDSVAVAFGDTETPGLMHFVRTTDKGATWSEIEGIDYLGASYGYYTFGMGACNVGESIWCAGLTSAYDSGYVFRSYDAGVTWESFKIPEDVIDLYPRSIGFMDDDNGLISDRYGSVLKSIDGGETWTQTNKPDTSSSSWVNGVVWIPGTDIMVGLDDIGAFYTSDLGETWTAIEAPTVDMSGDYYISGVFKDTEFGYIFTDAGKVLRFKDQVPSKIDLSDTGVLDQYRLHQNFPNPFNPTTSISFQIPRQNHVKLVIYDILGREVISLMDKPLQQGNYSVVWNGMDKSGHNVSTGVYIYQLQADGVTKTRKMTFMK
ncbi:MAG: T9SS type A sorting domain-containing protein [Fidelibacterota bacterium]